MSLTKVKPTTFETCHYYIRISNKNLQCTDPGPFLVRFPTQNHLFLHFPTQNDPFPSSLNFWANRCFIIAIIHHCLHHCYVSDFDRDLFAIVSTIADSTVSTPLGGHSWPIMAPNGASSFVTVLYLMSSS